MMNILIKIVLSIFLAACVLLFLFLNLTPGYIQNNPCGCGSTYVTDNKRIDTQIKQCPRLMFECTRPKITLIPFFIRILNTLDFNK